MTKPDGGNFVDEATVYVEGGRGGDGAVAFRREKFVPEGGPSGGDGGNGGNVIFVVDEGLNTLSGFRHRRHFRAEAGARGGGSNKHGADGDDLLVPVPPGTTVWTAAGDLLADLVTVGQRFVAAEGGRGGRGNARFASSTHRAPRMAERGQPGQARWVRLELKLLADVGLVGFPNVGKSSLIRRVSAARPEVADYPFTTLTPHLGVVEGYGDPVVMADVPGLIEGAHRGLGLGDAFLRHLSRTRILIHLVDVGMSGRDPVDDFRRIEAELRLYSERLFQRPRLVAANKIDQEGAAVRLRRLEQALRPQTVYPLSALSGEGVDALLWAVREALDNVPAEPEVAAPVTVRPPVRGFRVEPEAGGIRLLGDIEDRAARTLWGNLEAERYLCEYLRRRGVTHALRRLGLVEGARVAVGDGALRWQNGELVPVDDGEG